MKNLKLLSLFFSITIVLSAQLGDIAKLNIEFSETPTMEGFNNQVIRSESEIAIFYLEGSRVKYMIGNTEGTNWEFSNGFGVVSDQDFSPFSAIKTTDGEYAFAYLTWTNRFYFRISQHDDTWFQISFEYHGKGVKLIEKADTLIAFMLSDENEIQRITSSDKARNWSELQTVFEPIRELDTIEILKYADGTLQLILNYEDKPGQYQLFTSSDNGLTWRYDFIYEVPSDNWSRLKFKCVGTDSLYLYFSLTGTSTSYTGSDRIYRDVNYIVSPDRGQSWSGETKLTDYMSDDVYLGTTESYDDNFVLIKGQRERDFYYPDYFLRYNYYFIDPYRFHEEDRPFITHVFPLGVAIVGEEHPVSLHAVSKNPIVKANLLFENTNYMMNDNGTGADTVAGDDIYTTNIVANDIPYHEDTHAAALTNNIYFPFTNNGVLADANVPPSKEAVEITLENSIGNISYFSRDISTSEKDGAFGSLARFEGTGFLFSGGFILSGYVNNELFANGVASASHVEDYQPGTVGSSPDNSNNLIYKVSADSPPFSEEWITWSKAVKQGAYYYDGDGNGTYSPIDHNGNGTWDTSEDRPDILYDDTYYTVYNDGVADTSRRWKADPLGIEVGQTIFASARNSYLGNTVFVRYNLRNTGLVSDTLKDVIFSFWQDPDVGNHSDDLYGVDTTLQSSFIYDDDNHDEQFGIPPAVFCTFLQTPKTFTNNPNDYADNRMGPTLGEESIQFFKNVGTQSGTFYQGSDPFLGDPGSIEDARNYANGLFRIGDSVDPCNWPLAEVYCMDCEDVNSHYWLSGNPVTNCGWLGTNPTDVRSLLHTAPFDLPVDNPTDIIVAYTIDRGADGMESITKTRERVQYLLEEYERNFSTIVGVEDQPEEVLNSYSLSQNYPNPFNPTTNIKYVIANGVKQSVKTSLIVYDILGRKVKTLVNETKSPGSYEVQFDASQLASGVYFYRLTAGDFVKTKKMMLIK